METNVNYTLVGLFVIALLFLLVLGVVWLTTGLRIEEYSYYKVYMSEPVSGLTPDEPVEFNGVAVGKIQAIKINKKNPELVELLLRIKSSTPVTKGTVATLSLRGLTGITYITLEDKGKDKRALLATPGETYPVIPTKPSILVKLDTILTQMSTTFDKISDNFAEVSHSINKLLDQENLTSLKRMLHSGKKSFHTIQMQTLPSVNRTIMGIDKLTQDLADTAAEIKQNPSLLIRGKQPQPLGPGE